MSLLYYLIAINPVHYSEYFVKTEISQKNIKIEVGTSAATEELQKTLYKNKRNK